MLHCMRMGTVWHWGNYTALYTGTRYQVTYCLKYSWLTLLWSTSSTPLPWSTCAFSMHLSASDNGRWTNAPTYATGLHTTATKVPLSSRVPQKRKMILHCQKQTVVLMLGTIYIYISSTLSQVTSSAGFHHEARAHGHITVIVTE